MLKTFAHQAMWMEPKRNENDEQAEQRDRQMKYCIDETATAHTTYNTCKNFNFSY